MQSLKLSKVLLFSLIISLIFPQNEFNIVDYRFIPKDLEALGLRPNGINWAFGNDFLLLDNTFVISNLSSLSFRTL